MDELKSCPFCGGVPYLANVAMPGCSYVVCTDCRMQSDDGSKDRVVKKWNTRNDAALRELTLQCLAHQGQAQEAYEAQLKAEAGASKARVDALIEAADVCITQKDRRNEQRRKYPDAGREQLQRWMAGSLQCQFNADTILALIEKEPKP